MLPEGDWLGVAADVKAAVFVPEADRPTLPSLLLTRSLSLTSMVSCTAAHAHALPPILGAASDCNAYVSVSNTAQHAPQLHSSAHRLVLLYC